jgi:hypothetical protein
LEKSVSNVKFEVFKKREMRIFTNENGDYVFISSSTQVARSISYFRVDITILKVDFAEKRNSPYHPFHRLR